MTIGTSEPQTILKHCPTHWLSLLRCVNCFIAQYVIVITRAEDIMADNNPSPRAQPEDECYYRHHIQGNGL